MSHSRPRRNLASGSNRGSLSGAMVRRYSLRPTPDAPAPARPNRAIGGDLATFAGFYLAGLVFMLVYLG